MEPAVGRVVAAGGILLIVPLLSGCVGVPLSDIPGASSTDPAGQGNNPAPGANLTLNITDVAAEWRLDAAGLNPEPQVLAGEVLVTVTIDGTLTVDGVGAAGWVLGLVNITIGSSCWGCFMSLPDINTEQGYFEVAVGSTGHFTATAEVLFGASTLPPLGEGYCEAATLEAVGVAVFPGQRPSGEDKELEIVCTQSYP